MPSLAEMQRAMQDRLRELEPLVAEYRELEELDRRWSEALSSAAPARPPEPAEPRRRRSQPPTERRRRVPVAERRREMLRLIGERPMIDVGDLARALDLSRPRVSQLTAQLQREGAIRRSGAGFLVEPARVDADLPPGEERSWEEEDSGELPTADEDEAAEHEEADADDEDLALEAGDVAVDELSHPSEAELEHEEH